MLTTTHINLWSWLQDADHDVWLYLYNNYLVHVINAKKMHPQIHRPLQFKRMVKDLHKNHLGSWDELRDSRAYCRYLAGRYTLYHNTMDDGRQNLYICGLKMAPLMRGWPLQDSGINVGSWTKEDCIEKCKELDIHYRKSWTKGKIVRAMLDHEDNCYITD